MTKTAVLVLLFTACLYTAATGSDPALLRVRIDAPDARELAVRLAAEGRDVLRGFVTDTSVELIVSPDELAELSAAGLATTTLAAGRPFREIQAERQAGKSVPEGYPDLDGVYAALAAAEAAYPDICRVVDLTETYGTPPTEMGRHLYALKISDIVALDEDEPAILAVANHHAREIVTPVIALSIVDSLTTRYGVDPTLTALVDDNEVWIAPVWNPDGYAVVFDAVNFWRKNMRDNLDGSRGVDLNRNYPQGWDSACAGTSIPSDSAYKGPAPASEPETQTMMAWSRDRRFGRVIDLHSAGREVAYGYSCWLYPFSGFFQALASLLTTEIGYDSYRPAEAHGEHFQWQFAQMSAMAFLLETQRDFQPPYPNAQTEATLVWPGLVWLFTKTIPLWGHVTNAVTGEPVEAVISLPGVTFEHDETCTSGGPHGRYQVFGPTRSYDLVFTAEGYEPFIVEDLAVVSSQSLRLDVALTPLATAVADGTRGPAVTVDQAGGVLRYTLAEPTRVRLDIFDLQGARMRTLVREHQSAGSHAVPWRGLDDRGRPVGSGQYFYRLVTDAGLSTGKVLLVR
jgi:hypothetical protein